MGGLTNPLLQEFNGLSPAAKSALMQAHASATSQAAAPPAAPPLITDPNTQSKIPPLQVPKSEPAPSMPSSLGSSGGPSLPAAPMPSLGPAPRGTIAGEQAEQGRLLGSGSGISQIHSKIENSSFGQNHPLLGKILGYGAQIPATLADSAVSTVAPALTANLPGTELHHERLLRQNGRQLGEDVGNAEKQAQTGEAQARTGLTSEETAELPGKNQSEEALQGAQTTEAQSRTAQMDEQTKVLTAAQQPLDERTAPQLEGIWAPVKRQLGITTPLFTSGMPPAQIAQRVDALKTLAGANEKQTEFKEREGDRTQAEKDRVQFHSDSESDKAASRALMASLAGNKTDKATQQAVYKAYTPVLDSAERVNIMTQNAENALRGNQQAGLSLLSNHIGMTMGLVKGARINKEIYKEAEQSQPWLQGVKAHFDSDGYLSGVALSPPQIGNMVDLAPGRLREDTRKARSESRYLGAQDDGPERTPSAATIRYYLFKANGDKEKAKQAAAEDGWTIGGSNAPK